jgi:putative intracellular protease/amidase
MKVLMVLTSHDKLGATGDRTGFWLEELAAPYFVFRDAGAQITLASPRGGRPPVDPRSESPDAQTEATRRFAADRVAQQQLADTIRLVDVSASDYDAVFYPGGHGPLWDLAENRASIRLIEKMLADEKPVGAVCHAPAALRHVRARNAGPLVLGRKVTGFSNSEEDAVGLTKVVPYLVEDTLKHNGGLYSKAGNFAPHVVVDGMLVTGQNPASSACAAHAVIRLLKGSVADRAATPSGTHRGGGVAVAAPPH